MRRWLVLSLMLVVLLVGAGMSWVLFARPGVSAASGVDGDITIRCTAASGVSADACRDWGDDILMRDPAPRTFERDDLRWLTIDRSLVGFGGECTVAYFIGRYPDEPVWRGEVACR